MLALNWTQKIMLVLQDKDSLLQHLANLPVGLTTACQSMSAQTFE